MEPTSVLAALTHAFTLGMKGWKALQSNGFDQADVEAIKTALDIGTKAAGTRRAEPSAAATYLALVLAAFGRAFERHWVGTRSLRPPTGLARFFGRDDAAQRHEIETRLSMARLTPVTVGDRAPGTAELAGLDMLTASPLHTPYYRELWRVFSEPRLVLPGEQPPLDMQEDTARQFERHFLLAWWEARTSPAGRKVQDYVLGLDEYRGRVVRESLLEDMANWRERHVFGGVPRDRWDDGHPVPFLPLGRMYVEPHARRAGTREDPEPVLSCLRQWLDDRKPESCIVVVKADFGSGKSLSARSLACELADGYLRATRVSVDCWLPVFIRCAEDFTGTSFDLAGTVRRAWQRQAQHAGIWLAADDPAFALPDREQRVLYVLDGLDEVSLDRRHLDDLFDRLREKATERHRFLLLSRPAALPDTRTPAAVAFFDILPFDVDIIVTEHPVSQVANWLQAWNETTERQQPITVEGLSARNLLPLAATPILLFMIAQTWDETSAGQALPSRADIYEAFFTEIARGKHRFDTDWNEPVARAAELLRRRLIEEGEIVQLAEPHQAMLWLLSRVAWEERRLSRRGEALTRRHVSNLLHEDLALDEDVAGVVEIGLLLALQADLRTDRPQILFGHKSFREFSNARWWADRLHKIARARDRDRKKYEVTLYDARLLDHEDASFQFLLEMLGADHARPGGSPPPWSDDLRAKLVTWAEDCFNDEEQEFAEDKKSGASTAMRLDRRTMLREAALAIGSATPGSRGIAMDNPQALRSLLAWFFAVEELAIIIARKATLKNAALAGVRLLNADFQQADLEGADLEGTNLQGANLQRANLRRANLRRADLESAFLQGANLQGASLESAHLEGANLGAANTENAFLQRANLQRAFLRDANMEGAFLRDANLQRANMEGANLQGTSLQDVNLEGANLRFANLQRANLRFANLQDANLQRANLQDANLQRANLQDANLRGANLEGATLQDANLQGVIYGDDTWWPEGFDATGAGARRPM